MQFIYYESLLSLAGNFIDYMPFKQYMPLRLHWCYEHDCRDQSIMQVNILSWVLTKRCECV